MPIAAVLAPLVVSPLLALAAPPSPGWRWPLVVPPSPVVARRFEPPAGPYGPGHRGVDLAAVPHAVVLAAGAGTVSFAGVVAGTPVVSVLHTGGVRTTYEPVSALVRAGQPVSAGQPIGTLLAGHGDCGPGRWCLHWGVIRGGAYVDPLSLLHLGPARLLPLPEPAAAMPTGSLATAPATAPAIAPATPPQRQPDQARGGSGSGPVGATTVAAAVTSTTTAAAAGLVVTGARRRKRS